MLNQGEGQIKEMTEETTTIIQEKAGQSLEIKGPNPSQELTGMERLHALFAKGKVTGSVNAPKDRTNLRTSVTQLIRFLNIDDNLWF